MSQDVSSVTIHCAPARSSDPPLARCAEPVTCGVPWPRGALLDEGTLTMTGEDGELVPLQARTLERWPDGSVRWTLLDWLASAPSESASFKIEAGAAPAGETLRSIAERDRSGAVVVDTGRCRATFRPGDRLFDELLVAGSTAWDAERSALYALDADGRRHALTVERVDLEELGPIRAAVRLVGGLDGPRGVRLAKIGIRVHLVRDSATLSIEVTITNDRPAGHPGGRWSLGSEGSVYLRDLALRHLLPAGGETSVRAAAVVEEGGPVRLVDLPWELFQASSGGARWNSSNHVDRHGQVPLAFRGYRVTEADAVSSGERSTPVATVERDGRHVGVAYPQFWQNFPKAIVSSESGVTLHFFPPQAGSLHELQGGEQKTHRFYLALMRDEVTETPLAWCLRPLIAQAEPKVYARACAVRYLTPRRDDGNDRYLDLVDQAIVGDDTFVDKREAIDEYGWRHFGDIYGDHEAAFAEGPEPFISHYNNQYDAVRGFAIQFLRGGPRDWYEMMDALAQHVVDIDIYHTDGDKSAYNRGQFWHTVHYVDAGTGTHRSYPPVEGVHGGGPSTGQLYTTGLLLHHLMTGSAASRDAVLGLGQYVIDADDGAKTIFRFLDRSYTGHVSESGADHYHGPGRSPANAINALVDCHRLTGERRFLDKAEQLIRRTIHPGDDLEARNLLDAELRWYYTMYLQALGKYLDWKSECGALDEMYAYAQAALLRYAHWAADHEYPYLDKPEILEYPTETWAAQEMRKSEVFRIACRHEENGALRDRFRERARFFFDASISTLAGMKTRSFCRPVVLLTVCGHSQAYVDRFPDECTARAPVVPEGFGRPATFVSQKTRVKRKLRILVSVGALFAVGLAIWLLIG